MIKKTLLILFITVTIIPQTPVKKWVVVQDLQDRIVYLDTTSIKIYNSQLSVWSLSVFREPQNIAPFQEDVYQIKSNFVFNDAPKTYSVIGTLYYDDSFKIIGESSAPRISGGESKFELPIREGTMVEALFLIAKNYLITGQAQIPGREFSKNNEISKRNVSNKNRDEILKDTALEQDGPLIISPEQNLSLIESGNDNKAQKNKSEEKEDSQERVSKTAELLKKILEKDEAPETSVKTDLKPESEKAEEKSQSKNYNPTNEKNIQVYYWSDGNQYIIQLSSWKNKEVAQKIVNQLKSKGHNAYVMRAELPGKGTWYRVRIGYFNSLEEAKNYKRTNNL